MMTMRRRLMLASICLLAEPAIANEAVVIKVPETVGEFLMTHCIDCHNEGDEKGDREFETLAATINDDDVLVDYQDILDQLNLGEMPPPEVDQPDDDERLAIITALTDVIAAYHQQRTDNRGESVLRRLNTREYRNTVRDLLRLDTTIFDPTESFPRDQTVDHLDNVGESLVTSSFLLAKYLEAAEQVIDRAMYPLEKPATKTWKFDDGFQQQPEIDNVHRRTNGFRHLTLYDVPGADKHEGAYAAIHDFANGVPFDGVYEITFQAQGLYRDHPYDDDVVGTSREESFRIGIVPGNQDVGDLHLPQPIEPLLASIDITDDADVYTVHVQLDRGHTPRFIWQNGLMDARSLWTKVLRKYPDQFPPKIKGIVDTRFNAIKLGKLPQVHIDNVRIRGPIVDAWPTASQRVLLGDDFSRLVQTGSLTTGEIRSHIKRFADKAYRRTATTAEVDSIMSVIAARAKMGRSPIEAIRDGFVAVLCSPNFLYLDQTRLDDSMLSGPALATRLSYFLWSTMPDDTLMRLADRGKLSSPDVLRQQVARMLRDERSDAFVDGFLDSWLGLADLGSAPPDRGDFRDYYRFDLKTAMRTETRMFVRAMIEENLSLDHVIDSDFTFVNAPLAKHYGIDAPAEPGFHRVTLSDDRRGGVLGQASVLTVTANGIDTSPVVRGVWMLENFLGTPPSPPPPDVEPLDPDVRGATTIRDQLSRHRNNPTCYDCHRKIDPLGFALENYDPVGRWRTAYARDAKIDPSGELPDGRSFDDIRDLKKILLSRKDSVARAMTEKMLAYAIGRRIVPSDRPHVDRIIDSATGLHDVIEQVVLSDPFVTK